MLDRWVEGEKQTFNVERQDSHTVLLTTEDDFQYGVEPSKVFVNFAHRMRVGTVSAGPRS